MDEFKPCKLCGSSNIQIGLCLLRETYRVVCHDCDSASDRFENVENAIRDWNDMQSQ